ncbi:MAG TPA: transcriptional regulator [Gemmatimonadota bacterium]|nr:transcriptional regulator [Gemmatimonadota bacterium]
MPKGKPRAAEVREPLSRIDRLLEHRVRLAIAVLLSRWDRLSFSRLQELTGETDGSLGAHMRRMEEAGYVSVDKEFQGRKPVTWYALAPAGRSALDAHLRALEDLIGPH